MKKLFIAILFITFLVTSTADAQLRENLSSPYDYTGPVVNTNAPTVQSGLDRFFKSFEMSHSYEMSFGSFGGNYQNINAYTNTMTFALSSKLRGRVDVSFLHSPFGGSMMNGQNGFQNQIVVRNAELNYQINDKSFIRIQYQQLPSGFGYNPYGYGRSPYQRNRGFYNSGFWY